jgi:hypothetical protein
MLAQAMHEKPMEAYILKKTNWTIPIFHKVDWMAHEQVFNRLTRSQQLSISKLIHNLANTNRQNNLFYGTSNLCPGCQSHEETFGHMLKFNYPPTEEIRDKYLKEFEAQLQQISTPTAIINTILHGVSEWLHSEPSHRPL